MNKRIVSTAFIIAILLGSAFAWTQRLSIFDMVRLKDYTPSSEVSRLADVTTMNDKTRRLFYVYHPSLDDKAAFNDNCSGTEQTIVLGCYIQHKGIYLYKVEDPRLNGVVEVTAAHELLHAAYDRLPGNEKARIDGLTKKVADNLTDERIKETIENYRKKDASVVPSELHSILGTELRQLPTELEVYYSRYFTDRSKIVDFADKYKGEFTQREQKIGAIETELNGIKKQIDQLDPLLESQRAQIQSMRRNLNQLRGSNTEAYNAAVPGYNASVNAYNAGVNRQRQLVSRYNALVEERNSLAVEENELMQSLDNRETIEAQ